MTDKKPLFRKGDQGPAVVEICDRLLRVGAIAKASNVIDETVEAAIKLANNLIFSLAFCLNTKKVHKKIIIIDSAKTILRIKEPQQLWCRVLQSCT